MDEIEFYVYECPDCSKREVLGSGSVSPPEVHLHETEYVYCGACREDKNMEFLGLDGLSDDKDDFVLEYDTEERYCPLCRESCNKI